MANKQYLEEIKKKLDAMNKQCGIDPSKFKKGNAQRDPDAIDIFGALGSSALRYLEKKKKEQEDSNNML